MCKEDYSVISDRIAVSTESGRCENMANEIAKRNRKSELFNKRKRLDDSDNWWIKGGLMSATGALGAGGTGVVTSLLTLSTISGIAFFFAALCALAFVVFGAAGTMKFMKD